MDVQHIDKNNSKYYQFVPSLIPPPYIVAKADSGASNHYWRPQDISALKNIRTTDTGPKVRLPNNEVIKANKAGIVKFPTNKLSTKGTTAHVLPNLQNASLISLGQFADDNCITVLEEDEINIYKKSDLSKGETNYSKHLQPNNKILTGPRNSTDGLWDLHIPATNCAASTPGTNHQANAIIRKDKTKTELAQYLHAAAGYPVISTFSQAIKKGNFLSWPGIESLSFQKHLPKSMATAKGHLDQERKNLQSTKVQIKLEDDESDHFPLKDTNNQKTHQAAALIIPFNSTSKAYGDLTGRFPYTSSRGNQYILIIYDHDSNAILCEPLKNRKGPEIKRGWMKLNSMLAQGGNEPKIYLMDNEASTELKTSLHKNNIQYQLVPPNIHRQNSAERAIRTFKNHLLANLAGADPDFPVSEWDRLLPQIQITLNLLRNSRVNPALSSYAYLFGNYDFNKSPLAPVGTKVLSHLKSSKRASWAFHGEEGWYIGPSLEHYRCVKCFFPSTGKTRDTDTVEFFPKEIPFPKTTTEDYLIQATSDILALLQEPPKSLPYLQYGDKTKNALVTLSKLLNQAASPSVLKTIPEEPSRQVEQIPIPVRAPPTIVIQPAPLPPNLQPAIPSIVPSPLPRGQHNPPPRVQVNPLPRVQVNPLPRVQASPNFFKPITHSIPQQQKVPYLDTTQMFFNMPTPKQRLLPVGRPRLIQNRQVPQYYFNQGTNFRQYAVQHIQALHHFSSPSINHVYDDKGKKQSIDDLLKSKMKPTWEVSLSNEIGRLAQGVGNRVAGTDTIEFIRKNEVPANKKVTYANFICDYRPLKTEPHRVRLTVGGDKLDCPYDAGSPAASIVETKLILNSTISDAKDGARFLSADLKDHFLASPMEENEYMRIHARYFLDDIRLQYDIENLIDADGYVYVKIKKGMYGLKQAALLAYNHLVKQLKPHGYHPCPETTGLWKHKTRRTKFCLCVDDFGVKYFSQDDADHFLDSLKAHYKISVDYEGKHYCGFTIDWNYEKGYVDISMPKYIPDLLRKLQHPKPTKPQYAPHLWVVPAYGQRIQMAPVDESKKLDTKGIRRVQSVVGSLLYHSRALDSTTMVALNELGGEQANATEKTRDGCDMLLDYVATYPNAKIRFYASDMILHVDSDAAYLVQPNARSRYAGYYYLGSPASTNNMLNGAVLVICRTIRNVVASAAEAETGGLFGNGQEIIPLRRGLNALDHPQPPTPVKTDNTTSDSFVHSNIRQRRSKTWDMRWNWLRDKKTHHDLKYYWAPGKENFADYHTKHFPPSYHRKIRPTYILKGFNLSTFHPYCGALAAPSHVRGCVFPRTVTNGYNWL